jgi:hypothetical protein
LKKSAISSYKLINYFDADPCGSRYQNSRRRPYPYLSHQPPVRGTQHRRNNPSHHRSPDRRQRPPVPPSELCCFSETVYGDASQSHIFFILWQLYITLTIPVIGNLIIINKYIYIYIYINQYIKGVVIFFIIIIYLIIVFTALATRAHKHRHQCAASIS